MAHGYSTTTTDVSIKKVLTLDTIQPRVRQADYAVRGALAIRAEQLREQLIKQPGSLPFDSIVNCNIGNPQQLEQPPITFYRQVAALVECPWLLNTSGNEAEAVMKLFPVDALERARLLLKSIGSVGAYSHSKGVPFIRQTVANFIQERDGLNLPCDPENIFLTAGASSAVQMVLNALIQNDNVGVMIPIPQYPLYSATLTLYGGQPVPYELDEDCNWGLSIETLEAALKQGRSRGIDVRALCIINPGNPTGNFLPLETLREIVTLCVRERLVLLADEVYQENVYPPFGPFVSARRALLEMGEPFVSQLELFSFHSTSKGLLGECGRRGGYVACTNIDTAVLEQLYKMASISLCPNLQGQIMVDLMCRPPRSNEPSFELYQIETKAIYRTITVFDVISFIESLADRAKLLCDALNKLEGVSCRAAQGAMYLFPRLTLPPRAVDAAKKSEQPADAFYAMELLNATGVCCVPGSGFGQKENTLHIRCTFLPPLPQMAAFVERVASFHRQFMEQYK